MRAASACGLRGLEYPLHFLRALNREPCRRFPRSPPVRLLERAAPFDDPNYLFELKYDGFRAVAYIEHGTTKLVSRKGNAYKRFDELCTGLAGAVKAKDAIIDGEIVCLDEAGVPRFDWLLHRRHPPSFVAFDLLWISGRDCRNKPLLRSCKGGTLVAENARYGQLCAGR
jgi:ATP-dependent DNA ligase